MSRRTLISLVFCVCLYADAPGQTAETFFHGGARSFIDGNVNDAETLVEQGLALEPQDGKLLALQELLRQERENRQQERSGNNENTQDNQQQEESEEQESEGSEEGQQEEGEQSEEPREEEARPEGGEDPSGDRQEEERERGQGAPEDPEELSREQALRILQALQNEEEQLLREVQKVKGRPRQVEKDW
jgi:Ca-activated chloride channel family protein